MAAQFSSTKGPAARGPAAWIARAASCFPVPVSPVNRTVGPAEPSRSAAATWRS